MRTGRALPLDCCRIASRNRRGTCVDRTVCCWYYDVVSEALHARMSAQVEQKNIRGSHYIIIHSSSRMKCMVIPVASTSLGDARGGRFCFVLYEGKRGCKLLVLHGRGRNETELRFDRGDGMARSAS